MLHGEPNAHNFKALCAYLEEVVRTERERAAEQLIPYADGLMRSWPDSLRRVPPSWLQHIEKDELPWHIAQLCPLMRTLHVSNRVFSEDGFSELLANPLYATITHIDLHQVSVNIAYFSGSSFIGVILSHIKARPLINSLSLNKIHMMQSVDFIALATHEVMAQLTRLTLRNIYPFYMESLVSGDGLSRLRSLDLSHTKASMSDVSLFKDYIFDQTSSLERVEELRVRGCELGNEELYALAKAPFLGSLTHLDLRENKFTAIGLEALLKALPHGRLRHLDISKNKIGDKGLRLIAKSRALTHLEVLRAYGMAGSERGELALASSSTLPAHITAPYRQAHGL